MHGRARHLDRFRRNVVLVAGDGGRLGAD
jgi:hypothetical protein